MTLPQEETSTGRTSRVLTREYLAYAGAVASILLIGIGAAMFHPGAGLIAAGVAIGIFSYLLGAE